MDADERSLSQPYPGLRPFREDEAEIFFGREKQTDELLARLQRNRFIAVTGPSGCGKSSLVKAGVIPALLSGFMAEAGSRWRICQMRPGRSPLRALAQALAVPDIVGEHHQGAASAEYVEAALRFGPLGLVQVVRESPAMAGASLLLLVDQFEEIFRFRERIDPDEADAFVQLLLETARQPCLSVYVVLTMRSDYLGDCTVFQGLPEAINDGQYLTPRLTRDECSQAIRGPARVFHGDVEAALLNALLNDFGPDPDQLPLLQHALMRMWQRRAAAGEGRIVLARGDYVERLGEALDRHAGEVLEALPDAQQRLAQVMFRRLTERGRGRRDTRAPALLGEVSEIAGVDVAVVAPVVEAFRRERCNFVVAAPGDLGADTLLDIGHESLIRQWKALSAWVDAEAESAAIYRRLADAAGRFAQGQSARYWGPDLAMAIEWRERERPNAAWAQRYLSPDERAAGAGHAVFQRAMDFLDDSQAEWERSQAREREREAGERQRQIDDARRESEDQKVRAELALAVALKRRYRNLRIAGGLGLLAVGVIGALTFLYVRQSQQISQAQVQAVRDKSEMVRREEERRRLLAEAEAQRMRDEVWEEAYADFSSVLGVPKGIGRPLTAEERSRRAVSFVITTRGRDAFARVIGMRAVDARGQLTVAHGATALILGGADDAPAGRREAQWQYLYDQHGHVAYEMALDRKGRSVASLVYAPSSPEDATRRRIRHLLGPDGFSLPQRSCAGAQLLEFEPVTGFHWRERYMDRFGRAVPGRDSAPVQEHRRDAQGFETEFVSLNTRLEMIDDRLGNAVLKRSDFDPFGQPRRIEYRGADGALVEIDGPAIMLYTYDAAGNRTETRYLDARERPTLGKDGWHRQVFEYDQQGALLRSAHFDVDGRPATQGDHCHEIRNHHDEQGRIVERICIGVDGRPSAGRFGAARWTIEYDADGNLAGWAYFGGASLREPVAASGGWHRLKRVHDTRGNIVEASYFDVNGRPAVLADGYSGYRSRFEHDMEVQRTYVGTDGRPTFIRQGYAGTNWRYDDNGNRTEARYVGIDGRTAARHVDGNVATRYSYDSCGREIERRFLDVDGRPMAIAQGYAGFRSSYDGLGRPTGVRFVSADGQAAVSTEGRAGWRDRLNRFGGVVERRFVESEGVSDEASDGTAGWRQRFDSRGRVVQVDWVDREGRLAGRRPASTAGYARLILTLDAHGNRLREAYADEDGRPFQVAAGYAAMVQRFDAGGRLVERALFDGVGRPARDEQGAHRSRHRLDERGNDIEQRYFGPDGRPFEVSGRFHRLSFHVDLHGRELERRYHAADGSATTGPDGWHRRVRRLDRFGNEVESTHFAADGRPVNASASQRAHRFVYRRDDHGRIIEARYFDVYGMPVSVSDDAAAIREVAYDVRGHRTLLRFFDAQHRPVRVSSRAGTCAALRWEYDLLGRPVGPGGEAGQCLDEDLNRVDR